MLCYIEKRPMLMCAILCIIISVIGFYSAVLLFLAGWVILFCLCIFILTNRKGTTVISFALVLIFVFILFFKIEQINSLNRLDNTEHISYITVYEQVKEADDYYTAYAEVIESTTLKKGTRICLSYSGEQIKIGQALKANIKLSSISEEYAPSYYSKNIFLFASMGEYEEVPSKNDFIISAVDNVRDYIKQTLYSNMDFSKASTMLALLMGDKNYFTKSFASNVVFSGVSHAMVVSGMHLTIIVMLFTGIFDKFCYNKYFKVIAIFIVVIVLTALCGFSISMQRAGITHLLCAVSILLKKKGKPENTLGTAVFIILVCSPFAVMSVAFELSVAATFGILAVALPIDNYVNQKGIIGSKILKLIFSASLITLSATLITSPIVLVNFGGVSTVCVITNLLISYAVTLALSLSVIALILNLFLPFAARVLFSITEIVIEYINSVINYFGELKYSYINVPKGYFVAVIAIIILIFWYMLACKRRRNVIRLEQVKQKFIKEGGKKLKWR